MEESLGADLFLRFAGSDVDRWRELIGRTVAPRDVRWGAGRVRDVRWEGRRGAAMSQGTIYLVIAYESGLSADVNARAFADLHSAVRVLTPLERLIREGFDSDSALSEEARQSRLAQYDRDRLERRDAERTQRADALRRRVRKESDTTRL